MLINLFILTGTVLGGELRITNTDDYSSFVSNVNGGTSYLGTTVYLNSDLSLSENTDPIGTNYTYPFRGTFDGQGHIISNLRINSDSQYVGLFGFSNGLTIKNVILDGSCSFTSTHSGSSERFVGGIIGWCSSCSIENCVNMARVFFGRSSSHYMILLGGIVGDLISPSTVKNCVNYGSVVKSGTTGRSYIGGIVGESWNSGSYQYIRNCINYGTITHSGTSKYLYIGGIVGYSYSNCSIENCMSAGKITYSTSSTSYIGSVVGYIYSGSSLNINYCYFTSDVGVSNLNGTGSPTLTETSISYTIVDSSLISNLNSQASKNSTWNKWLLNSNNVSVTFKFNNNKGFSASSQVILLPGLSTTRNNVFKGWFTDTTYSSFSTPQSVSSATTLYGLYGTVVPVTFYGIEGNVFQERKYATFGYLYGTLPAIVGTKTGYATGWYNASSGGTQVTNETTVSASSDHNLYAQWIPINYTVYFNANGGGGNIPASKNVVYNRTYGDLPTPLRAGYTFAGWHAETPEGNLVDNSTVVTPAYNHTLYAQWNPIQYTISFMSDGESAYPNITQDYDTPITLPVLSKTGYTFVRWCNDTGLEFEYTVKRIESRNVTLYARWVANNYIVSFDVNGGDSLTDDKIAITFNSTYGYLPSPTRTGYTFAGWFNDVNEIITNETIVSNPNNHTLYAHWEENAIPTNQVEITLSTKELSKDEVVSFIRQYTNDEFRIVKFEDSSDGISIIIEFSDSKKAEDFIEDIKSTSGNATKGLIKEVKFNFETIKSFSPSLLYPLFLLAVFN